MKSAKRNTGAILLFLLLVAATVDSKAQKLYNAFDSIQVFVLLEKADQFITVSEFDSADKYNNEALTICLQKKFLRGEAHARIKIAGNLLNRRELKGVVFQDSLSLKAGMQLKDSLIMSLAYYQLGLLATYQDRFDEAKTLFDKSLQVFFEKAQSTTTAVIYNDMGYMYGQKGDLDQQHEWLLKALRLYDVNGDQAGMAQTLNNIATCLHEAGRTREALPYIRRAIEIRERLGNKVQLANSHNNAAQLYMTVDSLDQAIKHQQLGLKYAEQAGITSNIAHSYITLALLFNRQKKNAEALEYEKKAIALLEKEGSHQALLARRYIAAAILSKSVKYSTEAVSWFNKALELSLATNNRYNLRDIYLNQAIFYKDYQDYYNAYESFKLYVKYKDSIINTETLAKMAEIETKYETEKKDKAIIELNAAQRIKQLELEKQRAIIAGNIEESKRKQNEIDLLMRNAELQALKIKQQDEEL